MAFLRRTTTDPDSAYADRPVLAERTERAGTVPGLVRGLFTLGGVAGAGVLIWLAQLFDVDQTGEFWGAMGLLAAAGLALALSQLFGGWTKWGWPTFSPGVFLFAFVPTAIVGGWILLARQPDGGWQQARLDGWTADIGLDGLVSDLATFLPVIAVVIGLVFGLSFDTTGPRTRRLLHEPAVLDEDVHDYRPLETTTASGPTVAEELRAREERADAVPAGARDERVDVRDPDRREPI